VKSILFEKNKGKWMVLGLLLLIIFFIIIVPFCLLLHELGHGLLAAFFTKSDVHIYLGLVDKENKENFRIGRLHFHIKWGYEGLAQWSGGLSKWKRAVVIAGGPIMSLLLVLLFEILAVTTHQNELSQLFLLSKKGCFIMFIMVTLPVPYFSLPHWMGGRLGSFPSDGLQLLQLLRNKNP